MLTTTVESAAITGSGQESDNLIHSTDDGVDGDSGVDGGGLTGDEMAVDHNQNIVENSGVADDNNNTQTNTNSNQIFINDNHMDTSSGGESGVSGGGNGVNVITTADTAGGGGHHNTVDTIDIADPSDKDTVITECDNTTNAPAQLPSSVGQSGLSLTIGGQNMSGGGGLMEYGGHHQVQQQHDHPDTKEGIEELCPVCGDKVSGYHYGLLTCESCKGFFKRTVQNKKVYTCVADRSCHIDKSQRKRCPFCRFQKCLDVGMKLEAVRADRMRGGRNKFGPMYKRDRARRLQLLRQKQLTRPQCQAPVSLNHNTGGRGGNGSGEVGPHFLAALHGVPTTAHIYSADGIKQELIQIPQLSSSTSSPDSSPSSGQQPLAIASSGHQFVTVSGGQSSGPHVQTQQQQQPQHPPNAVATIHSPVGAPSDLMKWVATGPGGQGSGGSANGTPTSLTPKNGGHFHYEGAPSTATGSLSGVTAIQVSGAVGKIPALIREFQVSAPDDKEWQSQLFGLLQNQTYNQCEVDLFELMCKVIDQSLFAQVDWARNSIFFKDLKVDDQMKLLQHAWSDMLVLDHIHQRLHVGLPDETTLPNGQKFDLLCLALLGVPSVADQLHSVTTRLSELKFDHIDYICLKFLLLLNPDVRGLGNFKLVQEAHEQAQQAVLEYTINCYPQINDKFGQLMALVPDLRALTLRGEEFLYYKHMGGSAPTQTLLMEMLHAKKK